MTWTRIKDTERDTLGSIFRGKTDFGVWLLRPVKHRTFLPLLTKSLDYRVIPVPPSEHGTFYTKDCYIVINREDKETKIHFWFGKHYTHNLPSLVHKSEAFGFVLGVNKHLEVQGNECSHFQSYFKNQPAIQYLKGRRGKDVASSRFFRLDRISETYRLRQIDLNLMQMSANGCFILDTECMTRAYISDKVSSECQQVAIDLAYKIRSIDHDSGAIDIIELRSDYNNVEK